MDPCSSLCRLASILCTCKLPLPKKKKNPKTTKQNKTKTPKLKNKNKQRKGKKKNHLSVEDEVCPSESHTPFNPYIFTCVYCKESIGLVPGLWFQPHYGCWALTRTLHGYSVPALCCGDPHSNSQMRWMLGWTNS